MQVFQHSYIGFYLHFYFILCTHAVLVEDMIPYSIASFNIIIEVIADIDFFESSHVAFLKEKYLSYFFDYVFFCKLNTRNNYFNLVQLTT